MMYNFLLLFLFFGNSAIAGEFTLSKGEAEYSVKHLVKTVKGKSHGLKGKMICEKMICEFLVATQVKSFLSSDSNRDLNMQGTLESNKYPLITVKGKIQEAELKKDHFSFKGLVNFHGVEKEYLIKIDHQNSGHLILLLDDHKVERPSLFAVKIENKVPVTFSFEWSSN